MFKFIGLLVLPFTCYSSELAALHEGKANKGCLNTYLSQEIPKANSLQDAEQFINYNMKKTDKTIDGRLTIGLGGITPKCPHFYNAISSDLTISHDEQGVSLYHFSYSLHY